MPKSRSCNAKFARQLQGPGLLGDKGVRAPFHNEGGVAKAVNLLVTILPPSVADARSGYSGGGDWLVLHGVADNRPLPSPEMPPPTMATS